MRDQERRERLAVQERPVRPAVHDVECRLEHAEERQRRPEQERRAEHAERGRVAWIARTSRRCRRPRVREAPSSRSRGSSTRLRGREPSSASARKSSGTNESSAKYAIIAARCVPAVGEELLDRPCPLRLRGPQLWPDLPARRPRSTCLRAACRCGSDSIEVGPYPGPPLVVATPGSFGPVDAGQALADLTEISSQVEAAVVVGAGGRRRGRARPPEGARAARAGLRSAPRRRRPRGRAAARRRSSRRP